MKRNPKRLLRGSLAAYSLLTLAACTDALPGGAEYQLIRAGDRPLPVVLKEDECRDLLRGGTVRLDGKRGFASHYDIQRVCKDSSFAVTDPGTAGKFKIRADTAFFFDENGKPTGYGVISADSMRIQGQIYQLLYVRSSK